MQQMAVEGQPDKMMSDTEAWMKHSSTWKKKTAPTDIHQHLQNIYGDQNMDVSGEVVSGAFQQR